MLHQKDNAIHDKRHAILEKAKQTLFSKPIAAFSLNGFLQEHGISKGSFYHHFKDRDDLIFAILEHDTKLYRIRIENELYTCKSLEEKMYKIFEVYYEDNAQNRWICECYADLFAYAMQNPSKQIKKHFQNIKEDSQYLFIQSIQTSSLSKRKKQLAHELSEFMSVALDSFFVTFPVFVADGYSKDELWHLRREKIIHIIKSLCALFENLSKK